MHDATPNPETTHRRTRYLSILAATLIALSCGTNYAYSAWSPQFSARLHLSATASNLIGNAGNIGMYAMGIPGGILIDRRGPRWGVAAGLIALACGYFPLRSAYIAGGEGYGTAWLCLFALLTGIGSCTAFSAAIKVSATNWPRHRGTATAFPLSAFGLSAFFYTVVSGWVFPDDTAGFLGLLAGGTVGMVFVGMFFLQIVKEGSGYEALPTEERRPGFARKDSSRLRQTSTHSRHSSKGGDGGEGSAQETSPLSPTTSSIPGDLDDDPKPNHLTNPHPASKPEITGLRLLRTPRFWHLFILLGLLCGVGLMTINNIGNTTQLLWLHHSPNLPASVIQTRQLRHVSILSLCSFLGRLASGIGSDHLVTHSHSRFWTLIASALLFTSAQLLALNLSNPNNLVYLSTLTGLAYGSLFGVYPALVADAFGPTGLGINWGAMTMAPVLSGNIFNLAYGVILDRHSVVGGDGERVCGEGRACYRGAYWFTLGASLVGLGWAGWCVRRERVERGRERGRVHEG